MNRSWRPGPERRLFLTGVAAAGLSSMIRAAAAQRAGTPGEAFLGVSKLLTGRTSLDAQQSARLYEALATDSPRFEGDVQALLTIIADRHLDAAQLQQILDAEARALASLPRKIMTAWFTGVVGEGGAARCITFETSLMYQLVADRLAPPSYCYGPPASWVESPA
jgi:hypothetical protein